MRCWLPLLLIAFVASACTSEPASDQARELVFEAETPQPTIVPSADVADTSTDGDPPERLAFSDWTVDELIAALDRALDDPVTATLAGQGTEVLEIDGPNWRATVGEASFTNGGSSDFATRGVGNNEWVTLRHVGSGIESIQKFSEGSDDGTEGSNFRLDRFVLTETSDFENMWVPHIRRADAFFTPSVLHLRFVEELLNDVTVALAAAETNRDLETTSTDSTFAASIPNTDFLEVSVSGETITLSSQGGWTLSITPGVNDTSALGSPEQRDLLTRDLLLTETVVPAECIASTIEAQQIIEDGLIICDDEDKLIELTALLATADSEQDSE